MKTSKKKTKKKEPALTEETEQKSVVTPEVLEPEVEKNAKAGTQEGQNEETESEDLDSADIDPNEIEVQAIESRDLPIAADKYELEVEEADDSKHKGVVPYDPLSAYLREISRYPKLSREEEHDLALTYHKTKDREAAYKLVSSNLWLVVKIARDYEKAARSLLDLIQEGSMGLMEAVKNFDPYRGVRLPSYAVWWIKAYIVRYIIANWRLVKIGTTQAQRKLFFNLKKERDKLEREGFYAGPKLLADKLKVKESEVIEMEQRLGSSDVSMDAPLEADGESTLSSVIPSSHESIEDALVKGEMQQLVQAALKEFSSTLNPKELLIFQQRMLAEEKATLQDIAEQLKISRERVRQIENRLRDKLKALFQTKYGSSVTLADIQE